MSELRVVRDWTMELEGVPALDYPCEGPFLSQTAQVWVAQRLPW